MRYGLYLGVVFFLTFGFQLHVLANMIPGFDADFIEMQNKKNDFSNAGSLEKKIELIEAHFLKEVFLKHIMNNDISLLTEDDKRDSIVPGTDMSVHNSLMMRAYSQELAKMDILGLKKLYMKELKTMEKASQNVLMRSIF